MAELPKIALSRLRAKPAESRDSSGPEGLAALGGHHPDANLLAAFAEKALTETERTRVLHHLSHCAECREVAAFALPENLVAEAREGEHSEHRSLWPILRWGALAAMMGALAIVITLHPSLWQNHAGVTSSVPSAVPAGNIESPPAALSLPAASQSTKPVERKPSMAAQQSSQQPAALNQSLRAYQISSRNGLASQHAARQQVTTLASTQPPAQIQGSPTLKMGQNSIAAPSAEAQAAPPSSDSTDAAEQSKKVSALPRNPTSGFQAVPGNVEVTGSTTAKIVTPTTAQQTLSLPAQTSSLAAQPSASTEARQGAPGAFMSRAATASASTGRRWFISSEGKVIRSVKGGDTFETIPIAADVNFHTVAAFADDVWAGGAGGALFHSANGGDTWTRVVVRADGNTINDTITGIQIRDAQHLTITTASGLQWASEDGGQHWHKLI